MLPVKVMLVPAIELIVYGVVSATAPTTSALAIAILSPIAQPVESVVTISGCEAAASALSVVERDAGISPYI